ncbi:glycosyltransferase family 4 protein [Winogradskyella sp. Asnod2-B02-A]|uniref:glycosyltransferase family 4 protein n=1 Tax=Winogradskyella sp. Asnod2-B02-A TaxID=3160583 RepID=UPI00386B7962
MKIDFLVNSLVSGGAERVLVLLANYFKKKGHDVSIITFNEPDIWKPNENIKRIRLHHGKIKNHMIRSFKNLTHYYYPKKNRPDVLISFMIQTNLIATIVSRFYGIKLIASEHNNHLEKTDFIGRITRKYVYKFSNALTVLTNFDKAFYEDRNVNVFVMPNPCTFDIYKETERNRSKTILAVGALDRYHHKGFDNLIKMIGPVLANNPGWKLRLVGGGEDGTKFLKNLAEQENLNDNIIFEGFSTKVSEIMRDSDIYIMTSRFEGLPLVLLEAMSQGTVCISYDCVSGPAEIINHNINGILVENQNSELMCKELNELINKPEKRIEYANQGIKSLDRYQIERIYTNYLEIIEVL